jgi:hypothetical protein
VRRRDGGAEAGDAAADDQHVGELLRQPRRLEGNEVSALGERFEHRRIIAAD